MGYYNISNKGSKYFIGKDDKIFKIYKSFNFILYAYIYIYIYIIYNTGT